MRTHTMRAALIAAALSTSAVLIAPSPASAQWAVIDNSNLVQNILQAARSLEQINNQIRSLQYQALNLAGLDYSQLNAITGDLQQINLLMHRAQALAYTVQSVETLFEQRYPQQYGATATIPQIIADARVRWLTAHDAYRHTMMVQSQIAQTVEADTGKVGELVDASQGAVGALQASQATNQLLALSIKQQLQTQTLLAAQSRADALAEAGRAQSEEAARAAFRRFIGDGNAYTPR